MGPRGSVHFEHSDIEFMGKQAYIDVFCSLDGTVIHENDYLILSSSESLKDSPALGKFHIVKEPGNASGVSRIIFPPTAGTYNLFFVRNELGILGKIPISVSLPSAKNQHFSVAESNIKH